MLLNRRLGDFEIIRPLGRGGMGEVYEAQQLNPSRRVALKILAPWLSSSAEALASVQRRHKTAKSCRHGTIC
jgi:serine/threonine protein kinase